MTSPWWIYAVGCSCPSDDFFCPLWTWKWFPGWVVPLPLQELRLGWPAASSCVLLLVFLEGRSDIVFPPLFRHFSQSPLLIKDYKELPYNDICQLPQHLWVHPIRTHTLIHVYVLLLKCYLTGSSSTKSTSSLLLAFHFGLWDLGFVRASLAGKE